MNCRRAKEHWELYVDSEGDAQLYREVNEHLSGCPSCSHWYERQIQFESALAEKLRDTPRNAEIWRKIFATLPDESQLAESKYTHVGTWLTVAASLLLAVTAAIWSGAFSGEELDLAQLVSQRHERIAGGTEEIQFISRSDLAVEAFLKKRVNFPVRCPPRRDAGFEVRGGGVCQLGDSPAAYVHGFVGENKVSVFILPIEGATEFFQRTEPLKSSSVLHDRRGDLATVIAAVDRNIVIVVGHESPTRLERVVRAYGTYPDHPSRGAA